MLAIFEFEVWSLLKLKFEETKCWLLLILKTKILINFDLKNQSSDILILKKHNFDEFWS